MHIYMYYVYIAILMHICEGCGLSPAGARGGGPVVRRVAEARAGVSGVDLVGASQAQEGEEGPRGLDLEGWSPPSSHTSVH